MTEERDDYMRRQEMDHDLLRQRDPHGQRFGRALRQVPLHPPLMHDFAAECLLSDMHRNLHHGERCPECGYCFEEIGR